MAEHTSCFNETKSKENLPQQESPESKNDSDENCSESQQTNTTDEESSNMSNYSYTPKSGTILSPPKLSNPFAVRSTTSPRNLSDGGEARETNSEVRSVLAPATFTLNRHGGDSSNLENRNKFILRPSALESHTAKMNTNNSGDHLNMSSSFKLKPPVLTNPFLKNDSHADKQNAKEPLIAMQAYPSEADELTKENCPKKTSASNATEGQSAKSFPSVFGTSESLAGNAELSSGFRFPNTVPNISLGGDVGFVFGQNMNERVTNVVSAQDMPNSNGFKDLSFSPNSHDDDKTEPQSNGAEPERCKSLQESAEEYESRIVKRTYEAVTVITGEEDESNVLQMNCKLFAYDNSTSSWIERGRGLLRLNDKVELQDGTLQSRLVMRTQGSLRVVLNTKIWAAMAVDRPNPKSVRITAMDKDNIKIFLIVASPKDAEPLYNALNWRVTSLRTSDDHSAEKDSPNDDPHSSTESETNHASPKRRRMEASPPNCDVDSNSSEFSANFQDKPSESANSCKPPSYEGGGSSSPSFL